MENVYQPRANQWYHDWKWQVHIDEQAKKQERARLDKRYSAIRENPYGAKPFDELLRLARAFDNAAIAELRLRGNNPAARY